MHGIKYIIISVYTINLFKNAFFFLSLVRVGSESL